MRRWREGEDLATDDGSPLAWLQSVSLPDTEYESEFSVKFDEEDMREPLTKEQIEHIQSVYSFINPKALAKELKVDLDQVKSAIKAHKKSLKNSFKKLGGEASRSEINPAASKKQRATDEDEEDSFLTSARRFEHSSARDDFDLPPEFGELKKARKREKEMEELFDPECTDDEDNMPAPYIPLSMRKERKDPTKTPTHFDVEFIEKIQKKREAGAYLEEMRAMDKRLEGLPVIKLLKDF